MVDTVTVSDVRGRGNITGLTANTAQSFTHGDGGLTCKVFRNISGPLVADLTNHTRFPDQPDDTLITGHAATPTALGGNYGLLLQGYLTLPAWDMGIHNHGVRYRVRVSNGLGTALSDEVILGINPPRLNPIANAIVSEGQPIELACSATDSSQPA